MVGTKETISILMHCISTDTEVAVFAVEVEVVLAERVPLIMTGIAITPSRVGDDELESPQSCERFDSSGNFWCCLHIGSMGFINSNDNLT